MTKAIATWSGGKDSCLAMYKAMQDNYSISYISNTISRDFKRVRFHGLSAEFIQAQSKALGIPLLQQETSEENYKAEFIQNLKKGVKNGIDAVVFGDIHLEDCLAWAKEVCNEVELKCLEPLWKTPQIKIIEELISCGFEAIVVSTQEDILGKEWVGRKIDKKFLKEIKKHKNVDPCGENGEYHTAVLNGPVFKKKIEILKSKKIKIGNYYFLNIQEYRLIPK